MEANVLDTKRLTTKPFFLPSMNCVKTAQILLLEISAFPFLALQGGCWAWGEQSP